MAIEIYWGSGSPYSWSVLLALEFKQLPYQSHLLQFSKREHKAPNFLKLNPRGQVPVLTDDAVVLYESLAILSYLDRRYPHAPLFGVTPQQHGEVMKAASELLCYFNEAADEVAVSISFNAIAGNEKKIHDGIKRMHRELRTWENRLFNTHYLAGTQLSAADLMLYPMLQFALRAAGKEAAQPFGIRLLPLQETYPQLAAWCKRIEAISGYDKTYPPHWKNA